MKIIGIELDSNKMNYVVINKIDDSYEVLSGSRIILTGTRDRNALIAFKNAVTSLYNSAKPNLIAIKEKPESGKMRAGAASMKMEGIALANSPCDVDFVSGKRVNQSEETDDNLHGYLQPALKVAHAAMINLG